MSYVDHQQPELQLTDNVKHHIKDTFTQLLWTLFSAEDEFLGKLTTGLKFTKDPQEDGLHVYTRFPNIRRELPCVSVSIRSVMGQRMSVNQYLGQHFVDTHETVQGRPGQRPVQGFFVTGLVQFDVLALTDTQRDGLIDKIVDFFIWRGDNAAGLDSKKELERRYIRIDVDNFALAGDNEFPADQDTGDLIYTDGVAIGFDAELYQLSSDRVPLERIETELEARD